MLEPELAITSEDEQLGDLSYSAQYELLYQSELDTKKVRSSLVAPLLCFLRLVYMEMQVVVALAFS